MLYIVPKASAMTVLVRMMTLYGMLKSGVGSGSIRGVVRKYAATPTCSDVLVVALTMRMTAGATSRPLFASGGYSV